MKFQTRNHPPAGCIMLIYNVNRIINHDSRLDTNFYENLQQVRDNLTILCVRDHGLYIFFLYIHPIVQRNSREL